MRIAIDARGLHNWEELAGVGQYTYQLVRHVTAVDQRNAYRLVFNFIRDRHLPAARRICGDRMAVRVCRIPPQWLTPGLNTGLIPLEVLAGRVDVFHSPFFRAARPLAAKLVVTVHDLMHLRRPEFLPPRWAEALAGDMRRTLRWADAIIADSEFTRQDILEAFRVPPDRVRVIYPGADPAFTPGEEAGESRRVRAKFGIPESYVLCVGTLEPKKNHPRLIEAFIAATRQGIGEHALVIAGGRRWEWPGLERDVERLAQGCRLIRLGFVPFADLPALYRGARCFVLPSLFEGFGIPVLEAMACGTPVIASNLAALPEVCGGAALLVDPLWVDDLAAALTSVLTQPELHAALRSRGLRRAEAFSWDRAARETVAVYEGL